jgi:hypothetical protein
MDWDTAIEWGMGKHAAKQAKKNSCTQNNIIYKNIMFVI